MGINQFDKDPKNHASPTAGTNLIRPIIETLGEGPCTVDDVANALGERFPAAESVPVDDILSYLVDEKLAEPSEQQGYFRLAQIGRAALNNYNAA